MSVDFFGLDGYGAPRGGKLAIAGGAIAGAGLQSGAAWGLRRFAGMYKWSEAAGAGVAIAAAVPMMFFKSTRTAGVIAAIVAATAGVVRTAEILVSSPQITGLGLTTFEPARAVGMTGFGLTTMEPSAAVGMQGPRDPAQLLGAPVFGDNGLSANPAAQTAQLLGVQGLSGFGSRFGSTILGGN